MLYLTYCSFFHRETIIFIVTVALKVRNGRGLTKSGCGPKNLRALRARSYISSPPHPSYAYECNWKCVWIASVNSYILTETSTQYMRGRSVCLCIWCVRWSSLAMHEWPAALHWLSNDHTLWSTLLLLLQPHYQLTQTKFISRYNVACINYLVISCALKLIAPAAHSKQGKTALSTSSNT